MNPEMIETVEQMEDEDYIDATYTPWNQIIFTPFDGVDYDEKIDKRASTKKVKKAERGQKRIGKNKRRDDEEERICNGLKSKAENKKDKLVVKIQKNSL